MGYAVTTMKLRGENRVVAASEGYGPAVYFDGPDLVPVTISTEPGGSMGFAGFPGRDDALFMITKFYPIFKSEEAGINLCIASDDPGALWECKRIIDLPFVHRISTVTTDAGSFLIAATVCGGKDFQDDWSRPGAVYVVEIPENGTGPWSAVPILEGLHRNHGMTIGNFEGRETLLIAADEGVFAIQIPQNSGDKWTHRCILEKEVSEIGLIDLDGDGEDELVTIEPFHGETLGVYKKGNTDWTRIASGSLAFGHGLSVGYINGKPVAVAGNRSATKNLVSFQFDGKNLGQLKEVIVDTASGSAGTTIIETSAGDAIVSSNPEFQEYAIYTAEGDKI